MDDEEMELLAEALELYTNPNSPEYDEEFTNELKSIRPDWFADWN